MLLFLLPLPVLLLLPLLMQEQCSGACGAVSDAAAAYCARVICAVFIWGLLSLETRAKSVRPRTREGEGAGMRQSPKQTNETWAGVNQAPKRVMPLARSSHRPFVGNAR